MGSGSQGKLLNQISSGNKDFGQASEEEENNNNKITSLTKHTGEANQQTVISKSSKKNHRKMISTLIGIISTTHVST